MIDVKQIEKKLVVKHCDAPQINFGADFEALSETHKTIYLKKLTSSLNHALDLIQCERNALLSQAAVMRQQLENADRQVAIQKSIVEKTVTDANSDRQEMSLKIQDLTYRIAAQDKVIDSLQVS